MQRLNMISTHILFFIFFSVLCTVAVEGGVARYNVRTDCKCGRRDDYNFRIVGGREAEPNSNPWMVALYSKLHDKIFCGGTLINDRYVVTAAHCVRSSSKETLNVILGLHNQDLLDEDEEGQIYEIDEILLHENYTNISFYDINDIALIRLNRVVKYTSKIKPVCLPRNTEKDYGGKMAQVMGWGKTLYKIGKSSKFLKETDLIVLPSEECKTHKFIGRYILDSMLCAYWDNTDACQGDSGGPLTYETVSGKVELIGIVSWGIQCAVPNIPGVYTRVTSNIDWIASNTKDALYCRNY